MIQKIHSGVEMLKTIEAWSAGKLEAMGTFQRKTFEYVSLFVVMAVIYSIYLKGFFAGGGTTFYLGFPLLLLMLKFFFFIGWPFAVMAFLDPTWRRKDAAWLSLATYFTTGAFWSHQYGDQVCIYTEIFSLLFFVLGAFIGHRMGAWRHPSRVD